MLIILGLYWDYIGIILGLYGDNGKEHGNYYGESDLITQIIFASTPLPPPCTRSTRGDVGMSQNEGPAQITGPAISHKELMTLRFPSSIIWVAVKELKLSYHNGNI